MSRVVVSDEILNNQNRMVSHSLSGLWYQVTRRYGPRQGVWGRRVAYLLYESVVMSRFLVRSPGPTTGFLNIVVVGTDRPGWS